MVEKQTCQELMKEKTNLLGKFQEIEGETYFNLIYIFLIIIITLMSPFIKNYVKFYKHNLVNNCVIFILHKYQIF